MTEFATQLIKSAQDADYSKFSDTFDNSMHVTTMDAINQERDVVSKNIFTGDDGE